MPLPMTKSVLALAREAYATARDAIPAYSHSRSPKVYTQHQLFAILVLRQFLKTDYRGMQQMLHDWSDLRKTLDLERVPNYSTLCYAEQKLLKKGALNNSLPPRSPAPASAA